MDTAQRPYAVVIGEAIWDLLDRPEERCFAQAPGGSCLNVAVGVARLGHPVELVAAFGTDLLAERLRQYLATERVGLTAAVTVPAQSTLAVTTFDGAEPHFAFYGHPVAYLQLSRSAASDAAADGATVVHAGSIALLSPGVRDAVRSAYQRTRGGRRWTRTSGSTSSTTSRGTVASSRIWSGTWTWSSSAATTRPRSIPTRRTPRQGASWPAVPRRC